MAGPWIRNLRPFIFSLSAFALIAFVADPHPSRARSAAPVATTIQLQPVITSGLTSPVYVTNAHDGSNRLFTLDLRGTIQLLQPGQTVVTPFLDIQTRVMSGGEQGLLGLAFHPQFKNNGRFFVNYTRKPDGATVIAEYRVSPTNPNFAPPTEVTTFLTIPQPFANHNGGMIEFGPDGFLYIAMGDGGDGNDPGKRAQNINNLLGKILRIDIDHPNGQVAYSSPPTNPFVGVDGADEIYAVGMRNPWRFSFDRTTGQLYVGDVGQGAWEEIDIVTLGGNYGWRVYEGNHCTNLDTDLCVPQNFLFPIAEYAHSGGRCSITGGYAYRGPISTFPPGTYVYGDFCTGEIFSLEGGQQNLLLDAPINISSFGEDEAGEIYVVALGNAVYRIVNPNASCSFFVSPANPSFRATGGTGSVVVTAPVSCNWSAVSNDSFIVINSGSSGTGTGAVTYSIAPNASTDRTGTLTIAGQTVTVVQSAKQNLFDFDGDAKTDIAEWRPTPSSEWMMIDSSSGNPKQRFWGVPGDQPVPGDYDGDWKTDIAVWRPSNGTWYIIKSSDGAQTVIGWGVNGDVPAPGDYDGDGETDVAVWRPSTGFWHIRKSSDGSLMTFRWGVSGDVPVPGDYDGDGKTDITAWRPSTGTWFIVNSSNGMVSVVGWGVSTDKVVQGDYDGDGRTDVAVWRPSTGVWYVINSSNSAVTVVHWGLSTDKPLTGDFDGDGKTDLATYRPNTGGTSAWYIINSSSGAVRTIDHGSSNDTPVPGALIP
ncbi:MAG: PQQ-dependent sugar dehydrogenase [Blastocatellia bacterium]